MSAILEGAAVEWPNANGASDLSIEDRALLEPLQILAAIARQGRQTSEPDQDELEGRFELRGLVGRGASGEVYRAWDSRLLREIALKVVPLDRPFAASVLQEARRLARVRHPGVVTIYDVFEDGVSGRICMELLTGRTLDATVRESGVFSVAGAAQIGETLCEALAAIHDAGLVHGDVKAHNVLVEVSGRVVLMDLGAGARTDGEALPAREGTPLYMAPELFSGTAAQPATDIFSLGVLLYYLLTAGYPISGKAIAQVRAAAERGEAGRAALLHVPHPLNRTLARALHVNPAKRYPSARAMARALNGAVRRTRRVLQGALFTVLVLAVAAFSVWGLRPERTGTRPEGISARQIVIPAGMEGLGQLSPDAASVLFRDLRGSLKLLNLRTGMINVLAVAEEGEGTAGGMLFRPGHKTVLYAWYNAECQCVQVREVAVPNGTPRVIASGFPALGFTMSSVTADGSRALISLSSGGKEFTINILDLSNGVHHSLAREPAGMHYFRLSPDGRAVVYDRPASQTDLNGDLYLLDVRTRESRLLLGGLPDDAMPIWGTDGRHVYFSSDRAGVPALWRVEVAGSGIHSEPQSEPQIVHRDIGRFMPLWQAGNGAVLFWTTPILDIETAPFDPSAGVVSGPSRALPVRIAGSSYELDWSPDGTSIAYTSERSASGAARSTLVIHSVATGLERDLRVPVNGYLYPAWSPDGRSLLIRGPGSFDGILGPRVLDAATGTIRATFGFPVRSYAWSGDGRACFFIDGDGLHRIDAASRVIAPISVKDGWRPQTLVVQPSHSGDRIALSASRDRRFAIILTTGTGGTQQVIDVPGERALSLWDTTPDGSRLVATRPLDPQNSEVWELVTISVATGQIEPAGLERPGLTSASLRSDGGAIAYRKGSPRRALWLMEHLPQIPSLDK